MSDIGPQKPISRAVRWSTWLVALVTLKAIFMAFFVIPPADIPDESGHYAYVKDIAAGKFFPLLGTATIPADLWMDLPPSSTSEPPLPRVNYIVQHPPLYYTVAAIPYAIASQFTQDRWYLIRITRLVSALSLGLIVWVVFRMTQDLGISPDKGLLLSASIALIPTVSNLASGITNDIFLTLLSALATRYLVKFILDRRLKDAYICAVWLTLAGATKMTAWIMIAGYVAVMVYELRQPIRAWILHSLGITAVSLVAPIWWMARNVFHFGDPFYINLGDMAAQLPHVTVAQFLETQPFFYFMLVHFYALFGFSGYCQTPELAHLCDGTRITHINNEPFFFFILILFLLAVAAAFVTARQAWQVTRQPPTPEDRNSLQAWASQLLSSPTLRTSLMLILGLTGITLFASALVHAHQEPGFFAGTLLTILVLMPLLLIPLGAGLLLLERDASNRLIHHGIMVFALFGVIFILQAHKAYVLVGQMRGVQGRYFFPYIPMLMVSGALVLGRLRVPAKAFLWVAMGLALGEIYTYVQHVIPFMEAVKI